jgi:hypothetical protein
MRTLFPALALMLVVCYASPYNLEAEAQSEKFRAVPEEFKQVDFKSFTYPYEFSDGRRLLVTLKNGETEYEFGDDKGWFSLSDVYYPDLTGDGKPEALVLLSHVSCGGSCDGGAALIYIYTVRRNRLKSLWRYETGSIKYGCGLKSLTVRNRKITMELFGRCRRDGEELYGSAFHPVKDATRLAFEFNGRKFVKKGRAFISAPERDLRNYSPAISINEKP